MKSILFSTINIENDLKIIIKSISRANELKVIKLEENNKIFHLDQELEVNIKNIVLDEIFLKNLIEIIEDSFKIAQNVETDLGLEKSKYYLVTSFDQILSSFIFYKWFENKKIDIIDICIDLLFRLTNEHCFSNGNKRTAIISVGSLLLSFGLYLSRFNHKEEFLKNWYDNMLKIACINSLDEKCKEHKKLDEQELRKEIKEYIINHINIRL